MPTVASGTRPFRPFELAVSALLLLVLAPSVAAQVRAYGFVPLADQNEVVPMDTATLALLPGIATGAQPAGVAVSSDGRHAYVANLAADTVTVIDIATLSAIATVPVGDGPITVAVSPDNRKGYVCSRNDEAITVLDLVTNAVTGTIPLAGLDPRSVAFAPSGATAYVVGNGVRRIDVAADAVSGSLALATASRDLVITPDGQLAFVSLEATHQVQLLDLAAFTAGPVVAVGALPGELALAPAGTAVYVSNAGSDSVSVIDVAARTVIATIAVGAQPQGVAFDPDGRRAFVVNAAGSTVSIIDTATRTVTASAAVPGVPLAFGSSFITPPMIVPGGGPLTAAHDGALGAMGFQDYLPFHGGTWRGPAWASIATSRQLSILATGATIDPAMGFVEALGGSSGPGALTLTGGGHLTLGGANTHAGGTIVADGFLVIAGTHPGPITLNGVRAQLRGSGTVGAVTVSGAAAVAPGATTFGPLHASQVTFAPGGLLGITVNGATHAALLVTGTTALNGTRLAVSELAAPPVDLPLVIATNVTGTFEDLPEGAILAVPGGLSGYRRYRVSYVGGDGNDATVTKLNDPPFFLGTIGPQTTSEGIPLTVLVSVGDYNQTDAEITVTATSSNQAIVPDSGLAIAAPPARWLTVTPPFGARGPVTITLTVSDGFDTTTTSFALSVVGRSYLLAEGATGPFFDTHVAIANPTPQTVTYQARFLKEDGTTVVAFGGLAPHQRETIAVDDVAGMANATFSTVVSANADVPLAVERTMRWDATRYGAHTEKASVGAGTSWYFAEGSQGYFSTYLLLINPQSTANVARVTYFREDAPAVVRHYALPPRSRTTIDAGGDAALRNRSFGAHVAFDLAGAAERAMYFGGSPLWSAGHASLGTPAPSTTWLLAEGATGSYFTTFVLLANPNTEPVDVTLTYLPASGIPVIRTATIPGGQRLTRNIALEDPSLANAAVATQVTASQPIVVERSQYWGGPEWVEAHNSSGVTEAATRWVLAEGLAGGFDGVQTYILLANTGDEAATVVLTFLRTDGPPLSKTFTVPPTSRFNVAVAGPGSQVPELVDASFGTLIESTRPIVVERSMYWTAGGVLWAAGTNATATRLP
jgi:YVTN family beta-propeller protein/autotransporter-associated beta strand protein